MKKFNVLSESRKIRTKLLAMLVIGCSVISQLSFIPAYAGTSSDVNIALGKTVTASSSCYDEYPSKAVNGTCLNVSDKWCTGNIGGEKWLQLDLGENYNINRWVVYHAGVVESNLNYNTRDFRLQKSDDCITWYDLDTVEQNSSSITERTVPTFNTRYVRLYIDCGQQNDNNCARIFEFQLFCDEEVNLALNRPVSASKEYGVETAAKALNGTYSNIHDKWCTGNFDGEKWLIVDLGQKRNINRYVIYHAGVVEFPEYNSRDFVVEESDDGITWNYVYRTKYNRSAICDQPVKTFNARYVRLTIELGQQNANNCARIYEFQLFYDEKVSLAYRKSASASYEYVETFPPRHETADKAVNGKHDGTGDDKWCTGDIWDREKWLTVDLGGVFNVYRWKVFHAGDIEEKPEFNTRNFGLQVSLNGLDWETIDYVYDNTSSITDRIINPCSARYFRLWIDQATQYDNSCARIYELELF